MSYFSNTAWSEDVPVRPTSYKIEIQAGPDEEHLTHLRFLENVSTSGNAGITIPPGPQVLRTMLFQTKPIAPAVTPPAPAPGPQPPAPPSGTNPPLGAPAAAATAQIVFLGGSENLLKNPDFASSKDAGGKSSIVGWHGIPSAGIQDETGGPLPTGGYRTLEGSNGNAGEICSDRIPLQPDTDYVFDGWMNSSVSLGFRYLDADGKVVNTQQVGVGGNDDQWHWGAWRLLGNPQARGSGGMRIPAKSAFLEIFFRPNSDMNFAGLSFRAWPPPVPVPPSGAAPTPAAPPISGGSGSN